MKFVDYAFEAVTEASFWGGAFTKATGGGG